MKIEFNNGSVISTLDDVNIEGNNVPLQIIGMDIAKEDSEDDSCIRYFCPSCNSIFDIEFEDNIGIKYYRSCPSCKERFKGYVFGQ